MKNFFIKLLNKIKSVSLLTYLVIAFSIWLLIFAPLDAYELHINSKIPLTENPLIAQIIGYVTIILFIALLLFLFPLIRFILGRIKVYLRLFFVSLRLNFKFKLKRLPFASLFGVKTKEDICIICRDEKYYIHFIDVVGGARVFTLIDDKTYDVSKTAPGNVSKMPMHTARITSTERVILNGRQKTIPEFDKNDGKHIIMLDPPTMDVRYIDNITKPLFNGYSVGNITYYEAKDFIKLLKRI